MQLIRSNDWDVPAESIAIASAGSRRWSLHAVATAVVLATSLTASSAWALALGRVSVQSQLGQPLRAEIDIPNISDEEAASLQVGVGSPETFQAASMEFNPMLSSVRFALERRPNGRTVLRLSSDRVVSEPFLDLVVDVNWSSGHLVRGYTMLFDPPNLKATAPVPVLPAATTSPTPKPSAASKPSPAPAPVAAPAPAATEPVSTAASQVTVRSGDTAGRIAQAHKPANATLEQMLVGLLRANPHAFVGDNVNRMKAGVVLDMPSETAVNEVSAAEARRMIVAQSQDFNDYRRRLAALAPQQSTDTPSRSAAGSVQAEVNEPPVATPAPDKLTLSKGAVKTPDNAETKIAQERQQAEAEARQKELARNLEELKQVGANAEPQPAPAPSAADTTPVASEPALNVEATAPVAAPAEPPPAPTPKTEPPKAAPAPQDNSGVDPMQLIQDSLANPMVLPAAGGLAALLALLVGLRVYKRRKADPSLEEEGVLEAAGGQSVDTDEAQGPASSMMYSPSQLDAGGDVDPIAEADVYLAYGRDKQAEEILLEALRLHPDRLNVRLKLLEIYAQRRDTVTFAAMATEVFQMAEGQGENWEQARAMGYQLDPSNPLYQPAETPAAPLSNANIDLDLSPPAAAATTTPDFPSINHIDLDLPTEPTPAVDMPAAQDSGLDFDLDLTAPMAPEAAATPAAEAVADEGFDFDLDTATPPPPPPANELDFDFDLDLTAPETPSQASPAALPDDVQDLSLDLEETPPVQAATEDEPDFDMLADLQTDEGDNSGDPLETKLSLAREFEAIGDTEGARSLAEEVEAEATGPLQARARDFLAQLP